MIYIAMLGFNSPEVIRGGMQNFEDTTGDLVNVQKCFFDPGYPLPDPNTNRNLNKALCESFGWIYKEIENQSVMKNWNTVVHDHLSMKNGDYLYTFDPDVRMSKSGWIPAMVEVLESDPKAMFCSSARDFHDHAWMQDPPYNRKVTILPSGLRVSRFDCLIAWASGMWRSDFLITRPRHFAEDSLGIYGWNEHRDYDRLIQNGYSWLSTTDYFDHHSAIVDSKYIEWKQASAAGQVHIRFEEWLNEHR